jgi:hypothetical protein
MSAFRGILTGYLGAKIANTEANDRLKGNILESAGTNFYNNILPDAIANEKIRRQNYETLAGENVNLAELADINGFTASKEGMAKFEEFRDENKLKTPDALKNLNFETDYNMRYNTRVKTFEEKYNPILKQIGMDEIGGLGFNTVESLVGNKQIKSEDMAKGPVPSDSFASTQLTDYFTPITSAYQVPENEFAKIAVTKRNFSNVISFTPENEPKFAFKGTKDIEFNALRSVTNDISANYLDEDNKVNLSQAVEAADEILFNQTQAVIGGITTNYQEVKAADAFQTAYSATGFGESFNKQYPTDKDKKQALQNHLISLGTISEQKYFAISFPTGVTFSNGQDARTYLLDITNQR